jgi:hypothetical protein
MTPLAKRLLRIGNPDGGAELVGQFADRIYLRRGPQLWEVRRRGRRTTIRVIDALPGYAYPVKQPGRVSAA